MPASTLLRSLMNWSNQWVQNCQQLQECLQSERRCLIECQLEPLLQNSNQKEVLVSEIRRLKQKVKQKLREGWGIERLSDAAGHLGEDERVVWKEQLDSCESIWKNTQRLCQRNQFFIESSQKTLGAISENLRQLLGANSTYSEQGKCVESEPEGKVLEAAL